MRQREILLSLRACTARLWLADLGEFLSQPEVALIALEVANNIKSHINSNVSCLCMFWFLETLVQHPIFDKGIFILWEGSAVEPLATPSHPDAGPWADADAKELDHGGQDGGR